MEWLNSSRNVAQKLRYGEEPSCKGCKVIEYASDN